MTTRPDTDALFAGSVPEIYDTYLVPLIFESYAEDLTARLGTLTDGRVLELAAGTGVMTRVLARSFPSSVEIVGSDLNQDMLDRAAEVAAAAIERRFGATEVDGKIRGYVVTAKR